MCIVSFVTVIPSKNSENLKACVKSIREAGETCRIIVVDNGLSERPEGCEYVDFFEPFVFAKAINLGIQAAGDTDIIATNDDALLESHMGFTYLISSLNAERDYGCIGATTDMTMQPLQWRKDLASPDYGLRSVGHIAFVCVAIPRRTINSLGYLDERYCIDYGCEDRDYCEAVVRAGLKVGVLDDCFVNHSKLTSSFRGSAAGQASFAENYKLLIEKWGTIQPPEGWK